MPSARIEVVYLKPDAMHPYRPERIPDNEPGRFRPEPSPVEPRPLERNPEPARLVLHVQFVEHDLSGPLSARSLDDRQIQPVGVRCPRCIPAFHVFEGEEP